MAAKSDVSLRSVQGVARGISIDAAVAGGSIVLLHFVLLAANQWLILDQLRAQTPPHLHQLLADELLASGLRSLSTEAVAFAGAAVVVGLTHGLRALLLSSAPLVLHSAGVATALLGGWMLDLWIVSGTSASAADVAGTIREALPVVLAPFATARLFVNAVAALMLGLLLWRARIAAWRSIGAAVLFGATLMAAQFV